MDTSDWLQDTIYYDEVQDDVDLDDTQAADDEPDDHAVDSASPVNRYDYYTLVHIINLLQQAHRCRAFSIDHQFECIEIRQCN